MASVSGSHRLFGAGNKGTLQDNNLFVILLRSSRIDSFFCDMHHLGNRELVSCDAIAPAMKRNEWKGETGLKVDVMVLRTSLPPRKKEDLRAITRSRWKEKYRIATKATSSTEDHLSSLSSYLEKLHDYAKQPSSRISKGRIELTGKVDEIEAENGLRSLENYLVKVKGGNILCHDRIFVITLDN